MKRIVPLLLLVLVCCCACSKNDSLGKNELMEPTDSNTYVDEENRATYVVTFKDWNGDIISEQTVDEGEYVVIPDVPTRANSETTSYVFIGWDAEEKLSQPVTGNFIATALYQSAWIQPWTGAVADGFAGGNGSEETPYLIESPEQLAYLAKVINEGSIYNNKVYSLQNDLDLGSLNWTPIGYYSGSENTTFQGTFYGNGHTISNLSITNLTPDSPTWREGTYNLGLFGYTYKASIENCILNQVDFSFHISSEGTYTAYVGSVAGKSNETAIVSCSAKGKMELGTNNNIVCGGIVGELYGGVVDSDADFDMVISADSYENGGEIGGLIGSLGSGDAKYCTAELDLTVDLHAQNYYSNLKAGGLIGTTQKSGGEIKNCTAIPSINFISDSRRGSNAISDYIGGLIGIVDSGFTVTRCKVEKVSITGTSNNTCYVGGVSGYINSSDLTECFSTGIINLTAYIPPGEYFASENEGGVGGLTGMSNAGDVLDCYSNMDILIGGEGIFAGGFCGMIRDGIGGLAKFTNCYSAGNITSNSLAAGFLCWADGDTVISNSISLVNIETSGEQAARFGLQISGWGTDVEMTNCFRYDGQKISAGGSQATDTTYGVLCYDDQLNDSSFYLNTLGWSENVWDFSGFDFNAGVYPVLKEMR